MIFVEKIDMQKDFEAVKDKSTDEKLLYFTEYITDKVLDDMGNELSKEDNLALRQQCKDFIAEYKKEHNTP